MNTRVQLSETTSIPMIYAGFLVSQIAINKIRIELTIQITNYIHMNHWIWLLVHILTSKVKFKGMDE